MTTRPKLVTDKPSRAWFVSAALLSVTFATHPARAADSGIAEQLFLEGKLLMKEGATAKACEKFQASHDADTEATGTLLNLALCNELIGKTASAWAEFRQVAAESFGKREDRVTLAREHESKLLPLLSYLVVSVNPDARAQHPHIMLDQTRLVGEPMWDTKLPMDPGKHSIAVDAPDRLPASYEVTLTDPSSVKHVEISALAPAPGRPDPPVALAPTTTSARTTVGFLLGGVGVIATGVGAAFGADALSKSNAVKTNCPMHACPPSALDADNATVKTAEQYAVVSDIFLGVGAVMLVTGAIMYLTGRPGKAHTQGSTIRLYAVPATNGGAMFVGGTF